MGLFKKEKEVLIEQMTPLELVTHLFTCLQLADGRMDYEEKEVWADALSDLFPDHSAEHATDVLRLAGKKILPLNDYDRMNYAVKISVQLKNYYTLDDLQTQIMPKLVELTQADGIVLSTESEMIKTIEAALGIKVASDNDH